MVTSTTCSVCGKPRVWMVRSSRGGTAYRACGRHLHKVCEWVAYDDALHPMAGIQVTRP